MPDVYADITVVEQAIYADVILYGIVQNAISNEIQAVAGEAIVSWSAVVIINGLAYKMDASNPAHANAFAGFAKTGVLAGNTLAIQNSGIADFPGWGLIAGSNYLGRLGWRNYPHDCKRNGIQ